MVRRLDPRAPSCVGIQGVQNIPDINIPSGEPAEASPWRQRLMAAYLLSRTLILWTSVALVALIVSSLVGSLTESTTLRLCAGLYCGLLVPLTARAWLRSRVRKPQGPRPHLGGAWFLAGFNVAVALAICFGFSMDTGNALRRRGDWFLGASRGWFPRHYRANLARAAHWLEGLDGTQPLPLPLPRPGTDTGLPVSHGQPPANGHSPWYHPLSGPRRVMPPNSGCRFGARRQGNRPPECERGHCGVDLFLPEGTPVRAVHDGVVHKVQRSESAGGGAGKYVWLSHRGGDIVSSYVHLETIKAGLKIGAAVKSGEVIGTLGATGLRRPVPHLHFALAVRQKGRRRYVDPDPMLWSWPLHPPTKSKRPSLMATARP